MQNKILLISPHPDDIALSVGATVAKYQYSCKFYIWDVFTKKRYNKLFLDYKYVVGRVCQEEYDVWRNYRVHLIYDNYEDAQVRLDCRAGQLLGNGIVEREVIIREEKLIYDLKARYEYLIKMIKPDYVGIPLGIGKHVDHVIIRYVALSFAKSRLFFYEDMPYCLNQKWYEKDIGTILDMLQLCKYTIEFSPEELQDKMIMLSKYKSQLTNRDLRLIRQYHLNSSDEQNVHENIWIVKKDFC